MNFLLGLISLKLHLPTRTRIDLGHQQRRERKTTIVSLRMIPRFCANRNPTPCDTKLLLTVHLQSHALDADLVSENQRHVTMRS
ncbi:MAG: hypothetical protein JSW10_07190 [Pseudomonadota bacterium]|nr:MAG: hypothetical protein JSW10_07190 [Pseudomonadota bacterium]